MKLFFTFLLSVFLLLPYISIGQCQTSGSDFIEGTVYRDYNSNGVFNKRTATTDFNEPGVFDVAVKAIDKNGEVVDQTITDYQGNWTLNIGRGKEVRVEFDLPHYLMDAQILSGTSVSSVTFAMAPACGINLGVYNPDDYCEADPELITPCFNQDPNVVTPQIISIDYSDGGNSPNDITDYQEMHHPVSIEDNIGAIWGLAYNRRNDAIFASRYNKTAHELGTMNTTSTGVLFKIDNSTNNPSVNGSVSIAQTTEFMDFGAYTGAEPTGGDTWKAQNKDDYPTEWTNSFAGALKIGLGDIDISDDGETIYTVNLNTRELYIIPIGTSAVAPTVASVVNSAVAMPSPASCTDVIRPFGLKFYDGKLYIGMVCTGELQTAASTPDFSREVVKGYVYTYDPLTSMMSAEPVLEFPFNYDRGIFSYSNDFDDVKAEWNPWIDDWSSTYNPVYRVDGGSQVGFPQPMISDIEFDQGDMIIAVLDRMGEQVPGMYDPTCGGCMDWVDAPPAGDILRAGYQGDGTWELEKNATVESVYTGVTKTDGFAKQEGPASQTSDGSTTIAGGEYYHQDDYGSHSEVTVGGLTQIPGQKDVVVGAFDPARNYFFNTAPRWASGGLIWLDNQTGDWEKAFEAYYQTGYYKGNGFGDIEPMCGMAPLEAGNRVWNDANANGIQDAGEKGIPNVLLNIYKGATLVGSTTTDANGHYVFNSTNVNMGGETQLELDETYTIVVNATHFSAGELSANGMTYGALSTKDQIAANSFDADQVDSDADLGTTGPATGLPYIDFVISKVGRNTHALDFGFGTLTEIGDLVWFDADEDGVQKNDGTEPGIPNVRVTLLDNNGSSVATTMTDAQGKYNFPSVAPGTYQIAFSDLPDNYVSSQPAQGGDNTLDSDINPSTQTTTAFTVDAGDTNLDFDSGFYRDFTKGSIGNYVWIDANGNGVQDPNEKPIEGVEITLYDDNDVALETTYSLADGSYLFANLDAATYTVGFVAPSGSTFSLTPENQGVDDTVDSDANPSTQRTADLILATAEHLTDVGAGYFQPATISGLAWTDSNADGIQNKTENVLAGVSVFLYDENDVAQGSVTTLADGSYTFNNVSPGTYYVSFTTPGSHQITDLDQGLSDDTDSDIDGAGQTPTFSVNSGDFVEGYNAGYYEFATIGDFLFYDTDWGNYQSSADNEWGTVFFTGVTINLYDEGGNIIDTEVTNATGNYSFTNVKPGTYSVGVDQSSMLTLYPGRQVTGLDAQYDWGQTPILPVTDALDSDIQYFSFKTYPFKMESGETNNTIDMGFTNTGNGNVLLGNFVWEDTNEDGIFNGAEVGLPGVVVVLSDDDGTYLGNAVTDVTGYYSFANVVSGDTYNLSFAPPAGYLATTDNADSDIDPATYNASITVVAGTNDVDAGFFKKSELGNVVWEDTNGNGIQDTGEDGIPGVKVVLFDVANNPVDSLLTDPNGNFDFSEVVPAAGYYLQFATPSGYLPTSLDAGSDDTIDSDLDPNNDNKTSAIDLVSGESEQTWAAGFYRTVSLGDFVWEDIDGDGTQDAGEPGIGNVTVTLYDENDVLVDTRTTAIGTGAYSFANLVPGNYYVAFSNLPVGMAPTWQSAGVDQYMDSDSDILTMESNLFSLKSGMDNLSLDGGFHTALTLTGYVWEDTNADGLQDETGTGIDNVVVTLFDVKGNQVAQTSTAGGGTYSFTGLGAGQYYVGFGAAPSGEPITTRFAGGNNYFTDSDADATTGESPIFSLSAGNDGDQSIDAGFVAPLPVELTNFSGKNVLCENLLFWETEAEINNSHFEVEKSYDGFDFFRIGMVQGNGFSAQQIKYEFVDQRSEGLTYYRLKQVDFDGQFEYSQKIAIEETDCGRSNVKVYPNPTVQTFYMEYEAEQNYKDVKIVISDNAGRELSIVAIQLNEGNNIISSDISQFEAGVYTVEIRFLDTKRVYKKIVKID